MEIDLTVNMTDLELASLTWTELKELYAWMKDNMSLVQAHFFMRNSTELTTV